MSKDIFRKAALERIGTVDQLDKALKITSPMSWLALLGVTLIVVFTIVWSIVGTLPSTVTASGVIVNASTSTNTYLAQSSGTLELLVRQGDPADIGTEVIRITDNGSATAYVSDQRGYVSEILCDTGSTVSQNTPVFRIRPHMSANQKQAVVCYVSVNDIHKIRRGLEATITLTSADSSVYGHMLGRVINVDAWATSMKGIEAVVGSDNSMSSAFTKNGSVCAVTCELYPDTETARSKSGYSWSNAKGNTLEITDRMMCSVKIITKQERPITKLFSKIEEVLGVK